MNHAPTFCRVWAPATVANLNVGFDALGCALKAPGEFMEFRRVSQPGVHLVKAPTPHCRSRSNPTLRGRQPRRF